MPLQRLSPLIPHKQHHLLPSLRPREDSIRQYSRLLSLHPRREFLQNRENFGAIRASHLRDTDHHALALLPSATGIAISRHKPSSQIPRHQLLGLGIQRLLPHDPVVTLEKLRILDLGLEGGFRGIHLQTADDGFLVLGRFER